MINGDEEKFKRLRFNEDQLHAADVLLNGIDGVVMSSDPNHMKRIREELGLLRSQVTSVQLSDGRKLKPEDDKPKKGHAKYIRHVNDNGHNIADCSICGHAMQWHDEDEDGVPRFCWFCGAKIDGVED